MTFSLSQSTSQSDSKTIKIMNIPDNANDFNQWLNAMKMVARIPGGMPPEFRRKLWLALSDRYIMQTRKIDWRKEEIKCFSEEYKSNDEELGFFREQIVKDLHRTGSSLCSGPNGTINQGKLKKILLGYTKFNPEVGYCQGFNMLGALILQVMDKNEADSIKVMIYLIEGIIPTGYFCGSLSGLQVDMSVFRELLSSHLPKLSRHLQRLQSPSEEEPPLINMFNMQWFLTIFCTCLPMNSVLRVWDLLLIEGSDILLRTALSIWGLLERKILATRTADDFYCAMGELSAQLLNGTLIDSNGLVQKIVDLGRIRDIQKLRDKHLYNITPMRDKKSITLFYSDDECDSEDEVQPVNKKTQPSLKNLVENKDRIALDITVLKKQYDKLRERHRQAHIILTAACNPKSNNQSSSSLQINQLLQGKNAIVSNKGRRIGPPKGAVPPRINKTVKSTKNVRTPKLKATESMNREIDESQRRRNSIKWKDIRDERRASMIEQKSSKKSESTIKRSSSQSSGLDTISEQSSKRKSESSSYSDETESNSSSTTSLCDEDLPAGLSSLENSPRKRKFDVLKSPSMTELEKYESIRMYVENLKFDYEKGITFPEDCDKIVGPGENEADMENEPTVNVMITFPEAENPETDGLAEAETSNIVKKSVPSNLKLLPIDTENIVSTSQLSPIPDISQYISLSTISPLMTPSFMDDTTSSMNRSIVSTSNQFDMFSSVSSMDMDIKELPYLVSDEGVTNEFFERINNTERPTHLDLTSFSNDYVLTNETISNDIQDPMTKVTAETIEIGDSTEIKALDLNDRTRYLREKSCSMDTPNHPIREDLSNRSSSDSKVSHDLNKSNRISRIIEENTAMLDRLKKTFNGSVSEEKRDISIEDITKVSDTIINIISTMDNSETMQHLDEPLVELTQFAEPSDFLLSPKTLSIENMLLTPVVEKSVTEITAAELKEISTHLKETLARCAEVESVHSADNECEIKEETINDGKKESPQQRIKKNIGFLAKNTTFSATFDQTSDRESDDVRISPTKSEKQITDNSYGTNYSNREPEIIIPTKLYKLDHEEAASIHLPSTEHKEISSDVPEENATTQDSRATLKQKKENSPHVSHNFRLDQPDSKSISLSSAFELELRRKSVETILDESSATKLLSISPEERKPSISKSYLDELFPATSIKLNMSTSIDKSKTVESLLTLENETKISISPENRRKTTPEPSTSRHSSNSSSPTYPRLQEAPSDITATINSINNSIKSINLLCKRNDDEKIFARLDKIINGQPNRYPRDDDRMAKSAPKILIDNQTTNEDSFDFNSFRSSRNNQRCVSPRRRNKDEDKEEYLSRVRRGDVSPSLDTSEHRAASTNRYSYSEPDEPITLAPPTSISSPFSEKLEIRHTTFTSTFYDRFLFEKNSRTERSPLSPTVPVQITRSYLDSLRATPVVHSASSSRVIKSAENSPSRKKSAVTFSLDTPSEAYRSNKLSTYNYSHVKSCENIPLRAGTVSRLKDCPTTDSHPNYTMDKTKMWNFD